MDAIATATPAIGPIVFGTDFGPVSAAAETRAIQLARDAGVPLLVVNAIDPGRLRMPGGRFLQRVDQVRDAREQLAARVTERARALGVDAWVLIWEGAPAACIAEAAAAESASAIVVGTHGRGRLGRAIAGSVSETLRSNADCRVEVVGPGVQSSGVESGPVRPGPMAHHHRSPGT
jgi:nucleotide-binding universal stress UspA family protein